MDFSIRHTHKHDRSTNVHCINVIVKGGAFTPALIQFTKPKER